MDNTVVAVFDTYAHAENAMNDLLTAGFSRGDVQLSPDDASHGSTTGPSDSGGSGIGNFFRSLFGMEEHHEDRDVYAEAVRRGHCVLTVDADNEEQRDRAIEVLNRHSPVDIDERATHWRSQGWSGYDESAPRYTDTEIQKDRDLYTQGRDMSLNENAGMNIDSGVDETSRHGIGTDQTDQRIMASGADLTGGDTGVTGTTRGDLADTGMTRNDMAGTDMTRTDMAGTDIGRTGMDTTRTDTTAMGAMGTMGTDRTRMEGEQRIPVVEEELRVGKREVQRGGVRVFQRVREKPVNEQVNLREEHVKVERRPVDQPASEADLAAFKEGSVELRETSEEAVVSKTARVVEEVVVGKEVTERTENINDTVRRTDVEVEQLGADTTRTGRTDFADTNATIDDSDFRSHWQTQYGSQGGRYEDYDAAYRYGHTLSGSDRMKNYRWQDVEPDVRSDWESSHPESAWDKVKDAVRYGAERVKGHTDRH